MEKINNFLEMTSLERDNFITERLRRVKKWNFYEKEMPFNYGIIKCHSYSSFKKTPIEIKIRFHINLNLIEKIAKEAKNLKEILELTPKSDKLCFCDVEIFLKTQSGEGVYIESDNRDIFKKVSYFKEWKEKMFSVFRKEIFGFCTNAKGRFFTLKSKAVLDYVKNNYKVK